MTLTLLLLNEGGNGGVSSPILSNVSFKDNVANGLGIAVFSSSTGGSSNPVLRNVILWGDLRLSLA
ncbi:MAG: hypothetical protein WBW92_00655 [Rhodanobacteraceae bacterium]